MTKGKLLKLIIYICLSFLLLFFCYNYVFSSKISISDLSEDNMLTTDLIDNIIINGKQVVFDKQNNVCYVSDVKFLRNSKVEIISPDNVDAFIFSSDGDYKIVGYTNDYYQIVDVIITGIPIVSIHNLDLLTAESSLFNKNIFDIDFEEENNISNVAVQFFDVSDNALLYNVAVGTMNIRGSSSQIFDKKAYKLKFDHKLSLFNIYEDDVWVLDALFIDRSKIRNKLSSDLWNLINDNQSINNDMYGNFVEVFIDNQYIGLYSLKNKVNRDITKIDNDGIIVKSIAHLREDYIESLLTGDFEVDNSYFLNYEIKKYNYNSFNEFVSKLQNFYSNYNSGITYDLINNTYYLNNYFNYKLFLSLTSGSDNVTYNQYLSLQNPNSNILLTPWDMDLTWGISWSETENLHNVFSMESSYDVEWMNNNITNNLDEKTLLLLKDRYWDLRKDVITMDMINHYLDEYKELLVNSGAAQRDSSRWYKYNIQYEIEKIREWANNRILFLDEYFKK